MDRTSERDNRTVKKAAHFFAGLAIVYLYINFLPYVSHDIEFALSHWLDHFQENGRFRTLGDGPWNYTAPYVTLLAAWSYLDAFLSDLAIIKSLSIAAVLASAWIVYLIGLRFGLSQEKASLYGLFYLLTPTVVLNAAMWGQADAFYTAPLLGALLALLNARAVLAICLFAIAFSFKAQAVFFGPFLLFMMWHQQRSIFWFALIPVIYVIMNLPYVIAGQGFVEAMSYYLGQADVVSNLSQQAPNPWWWATQIISTLSASKESSAVVQNAIAIAVLPLVFSIGFAIAWPGRAKRPLKKEDVMALAAFVTTLMPFILPKMLDRYFFAGEAFVFLLMVLRPKTWPIFASLQAASLCAYGVHIDILTTEPLFADPLAPGLGSLFTLAAVIALWREVAGPVYGLRGLAAFEPRRAVA